MTYEEKCNVEIWGFLCDITDSQLNQFRDYAKSSSMSRKMHVLTDVLELYTRSGDVDKLTEVSKTIFNLDKQMFLDARRWYLTHIENGIPDSVPDDL